jgi:hypothetical protein
MSSNNPAFPVADSPWQGMTKREYAAIEILQGLAASTKPGHNPSVVDAVYLATRLFEELAK